MIEPISDDDLRTMVRVAQDKAREVFPREAQDALDKSDWGFNTTIRELILFGLGAIEERQKPLPENKT